MRTSAVKGDSGILRASVSSKSTDLRYFVKYVAESYRCFSTSWWGWLSATSFLYSVETLARKKWYWKVKSWKWIEMQTVLGSLCRRNLRKRDKLCPAEPSRRLAVRSLTSRRAEPPRFFVCGLHGRLLLRWRAGESRHFVSLPTCLQKNN